VAQYRSGLAREEAGDLSAAIAEYDTAIRLSPRGWAAYAQRGSAKAKRGEWREAAADYRRALELAPVDWPQRADLEERLRKAEQMASRVK
jgi:Flp pilus assembly protein TadD